MTAETDVTLKDAACRIVAFVVVVAAVILLGVVSLGAALKMTDAQAAAVMTSFVVLSLGAGDAAMRVKRLLAAALPGSSATTD